MIQNGIDALILEGNEAGGHIGPVSINVLVQEILPFINEIPVFVAGGIGRGEIILKFMELGASGCQIGTRFVCASESIAHEKFKKFSSNQKLEMLKFQLRLMRDYLSFLSEQLKTKPLKILLRNKKNCFI